jgi:hypothetical protein
VRRALPVLLCALLGCGGAPARHRARVPIRAATGGEGLLGLCPAGADAVLEVDLGRLRANPTLGPVLARLGALTAADKAPGARPLSDPDLVVAAAYHVGRPDAGTLILVRGAALDARLAAAGFAEAQALDAHTVALGPPALRTAAAALLEGGAAMDGDDAFLALRAAAMPTLAEGAALRLTARLDAEARIAAAAQLGVDEVPASLSLWTDVADDLALVAILAADDEAGARRLAAAVAVARDGVLTRLLLAATGAAPTGGLRAEVIGAGVRVVWVVGPRALADWAASALARLPGAR